MAEHERFIGSIVALFTEIVRPTADDLFSNTMAE
jgi:hypothetical protein